MKQLTKNIEYNLSKLFIEKHLYNFIRDFYIHQQNYYMVRLI